jgi:hypothetical protein
MKCADCRFYATPDGQCRKEPPTAVGIPIPTRVGGMEMKLVSFWPIPGPYSWCGEFEMGFTQSEIPPDNGRVIAEIGKH